MKRQLLFLVFIFCCSFCIAQDKSNRGKEFWLGYGNNITFTVGDYDGINSQTMVLYITTEEAASVTVSVNGTSWSQTVNIPANSANVSITLPKAGADDCRILNEGLFDKAIHIVSTEPVVVYAHQYNTQLSGATLLLPVDTYGYTYYAINYKQPPVGGGWGKNWFYVIASEDNTTLQITPADTTESGLLPGQTITVNLNKGQLYNVFGKISDANVCDLTGSKIVSVAGSDGNCHPVAMFSGCDRFILCPTDGGEVAQQQLFPASAWGTSYLTYHSIIAASNPFATPFLNYYRVIVSDPSTIVKRNGVVLTGLQRNRYYEFSSTSGDFIEADKPVVVGQYTPNSNQCSGNATSPQGDPELMFLPSLEQGIKRTRVYNTKNANITVNYLTIIIPNDGVASLRINGLAVPASQRTIHPNNSGYTIVARRLIGPGTQHFIESTAGFNAMIYGSGIFESYGYIAGTLINNLNSIGSIENVYNVTGQYDSFTCPRSPVKFTVKLAYRATSLQWLFSQVPGISPARDTSISNPVPVDSQIINGRKYFTYPLSGEYRFADTGSFSIPVQYASPLIDHCRQVEKGFVQVQVKEGPVANFNVVYPGCTNDTAFFSGLTDVNNYPLNRYVWSFDDGSADTAINTFKKFIAGDHPVQLNVLADNGCVDDTTITITTYPKPIAKFGYQRAICAGDSVLFNDSSSISAGSIALWHWNFADGNNTVRNNNSSFYHPYSNAGNYAVSLVTISDRGCTSDSSFVEIPVNGKPGLSFTITGNPCIGSPILFTPSVIANGNANLTARWNFGDGQLQTVNTIDTISHAYVNLQSNIPVTAVISGGPGCQSDTARGIIPIINPLPDTSFTISAASFCPGENILFNYTGASAIQLLSWDFGNGISNAPSPVSRSYGAGGVYPVALTVNSVEGCSAVSGTTLLTIFNAPGVDAGPTSIKAAGSPLVLNASMADTGSFQYLWTPGDFLNNAAILNPVTNTNENTVYTLTAKGGVGNCEASDTVSVIVTKFVFIPSAFSPNNDGINEVWNIPSINGNPAARVTVYNRWGQKIFESLGYRSPWDGSYKGVQQPSGAYFYQVQPDIKKERVFTGSVMIVR